MKLLARLILLVSITFSVLALACGGDDNNKSSSGGALGPDVAPSAAASGSGAPQSINLAAVENGDVYKFEPNQLKVKPGQVIVHYSNAAGNQRPHTFELKTLDGSGDVVKSDMFQPGTNGDITFTVAAEGTYQFICFQRGHVDRGQTGTLVVSKT